jgi:hypothetical protein
VSGRFDRALLSYAVTWAGSGRPLDNECLPTLGILSYEISGRVAELCSGLAFEVCSAEDA